MIRTAFEPSMDSGRPSDDIPVTITLMIMGIVGMVSLGLLSTFPTILITFNLELVITGPSWPYETSRVLTGFANLLNRDRIRAVPLSLREIYHSEYWSLLLQYARQHTRTYAINDTAPSQGSGHVFENLHPDLGYWNNRQRMYGSNDSNRNMGDDYNHSTFIDLILSGLFGIRPQEDGSVQVSPLLLSKIASFSVDHVLIHGEFILSVIWDKSGRVYNRGQGLSVLLDGQLVANSKTIKRMTIHPKEWGRDGGKENARQHRK